METINHEYYVSPEVAKLLEKAGFDWRCRKCYNKGVLFDMESDEIREQCPQHSSYDVLAPTLDVAQRWLREVKGWILETHYFGEEFFGDDEVDIESDLLRKYPNKSFYMCYGYFENCMYIEEDGNTYEDSLEAGIQKALEIILKD